MASKQFLVPGNHATVRGIVAPGATASLYTTGTTTPQPFYSDESRLVSLGTTITADAIGNFPIAYQDETVPFRLILKDRLGAELSGGDIDPFYFGQTIFEVVTSAVTPELNDAAGDGTTDDNIALQAWLDRGGLLHLPGKEYYSSGNLILRKNAVIEGVGYGFDSRIVDATADLGYDDQPGSKIRFAAGKGFIVQPQTTVTDPAGVLTAIQQGAYYSTIRNLALVGAGTGATATGLYCRTLIHLDNVHCMKFQGKGFDISATLTVDGVAEYGNASGATLTRCRAIYNGSHGFHIRGRDANVIKLDSCFSQLNGGWGFLDEGLLGNKYENCLAATNTLGAFKARGTVADHAFSGCYVETGTGNNCDIGKECTVVGGNLADLALTTSNAATLKPQVLGNNYSNFNYARFASSWGNLGAITLNGYVYRHADQGMVIQGAPDGGGTYDVTIRNKSDTAVIQIPTGTTTTKHFGTVWADFSAFFVNGSSAFPGLIATQGQMWTSATNGLLLAGFGSTYDTALANKTGTLALGVLTGTVNLAAAGSLAAVGAVTGSNLSGTNTGDQTITLTGNVTGTGTGSFAATIANDAVTYAKMQNVSATSRFLGRITAGAGDPEELTGTQASTLLDAATTSLQGVMSAQDKTRMDAAFTVYRSLLDCSGSITAAQAAATYGMGQGDPLAVSGTGTLYPLNSIHIASADYPALGTLNPKLRIRVNIECNDVAPGVTFTVGLHPITRPATSGGAGVCIYTIGSAVASSTIAVATPAADSSTAAVTAADFSLPADGRYVIGVVTSGGALAASSHCHLSAVLQMRYA